ncbi:MAG: glycosyltransferase [Terracidiphilus sp.]
MTFGHIVSLALGAFAVFGVVTSTVYSLLVLIAVLRFRRAASEQTPSSFRPPVSIMKALHGDEPDLELNLASFFVQDYPEYEILFCARHSNDLGLEAARRVAARFPKVSARILTCGEPPWPNARTFSFEIMRREAKYPILVTNDSDVRVGPDYLASVVAPLADPSVGLVTCLYRGVTRHGIWAQLEAMGMSVEMASGVLVANMVEGMKFALGPSMVVRQSTVEKIGGFEPISYYYADDFVLGNWTALKAREKVILSTYIVEHHVLNGAFKKSIAHQQGWATSTRFSRPAGHIGELLTYAVPFGLLALAVFGVTGHLFLGLALLAFTLLDRVLLCLLVAGCVVKDSPAMRKAWLYPLRDFMGFCFWVRSYSGSRLTRYRGDLYEFLPEGRLRKVAE